MSWWSYWRYVFQKLWQTLQHLYSIWFVSWWFLMSSQSYIIKFHVASVYLIIIRNNLKPYVLKFNFGLQPYITDASSNASDRPVCASWRRSILRNRVIWMRGFKVCLSSGMPQTFRKDLRPQLMVWHMRSPRHPGGTKPIEKAIERIWLDKSIVLSP